MWLQFEGKRLFILFALLLYTVYYFMITMVGKTNCKVTLLTY